MPLHTSCMDVLRRRCLGQPVSHLTPCTACHPRAQALSRQIRAYKSQTLPVVTALEGRGLVRKVRASSDADALFKAACQAYSAK